MKIKDFQDTENPVDFRVFSLGKNFTAKKFLPRLHCNEWARLRLMSEKPKPSTKICSEGTS